MAKIFILLLIFTTSSTALSLDRSVASSLANKLCLLAYGANESDDLIKVLKTECKPDCDYKKKEVVFVCKNYSRKSILIVCQHFVKIITIIEGSFCDAAKGAFNDIVTMLGCELKCKANDKKSILSIKCDSLH